MIERKFNSLDEMLKHLEGVIREADSAEAGHASSPELDTDDESFDWDLRRHTIMFVTNKIDFETPEQFKAYVEFIYQFMLEGTED
jgi:hypothetical protein